MAWESNEPKTATHSSIALLQERFRKLQRVKEMREGKELSKALQEPKWFNPTRLHREPDRDSSLFLHPEMMMMIQPRPTPHMSLSLFPDTKIQSNQQQDLPCVEAPTVLMMGLWPEGKQQANKRKTLCNSFDDSKFDDIDTSLHL